MATWLRHNPKNYYYYYSNRLGHKCMLVHTHVYFCVSDDPAAASPWHVLFMVRRTCQWLPCEVSISCTVKKQEGSPVQLLS
jgi:hypothetical protein